MAHIGCFLPHHCHLNNIQSLPLPHDPLEGLSLTSSLPFRGEPGFFPGHFPVSSGLPCFYHFPWTGPCSICSLPALLDSRRLSLDVPSQAHSLALLDVPRICHVTGHLEPGKQSQSWFQAPVGGYMFDLPARMLAPTLWCVDIRIPDPLIKASQDGASRSGQLHLQARSTTSGQRLWRFWLTFPQTLTPAVGSESPHFEATQLFFCSSQQSASSQGQTLWMPGRKCNALPWITELQLALVLLGLGAVLSLEAGTFLKR